MTNKTTFYFQSIKTTIRRFDDVFDHFESMFDDHFSIVNTPELSTIQYRKD